jgi:hypothetical protein
MGNVYSYNGTTRNEPKRLTIERIRGGSHIDHAGGDRWTEPTADFFTEKPCFVVRRGEAIPADHPSNSRRKEGPKGGQLEARHE